MRASSHIATIAGIPLKIHWTFGLLLLWVVYENSKEGFETMAVLGAILLVLSIFVCVILHEFGHALTARRFGVKTFDIIMTPIGGIARLERMPEGRGQEFWVAIAGPMVNFLIAGLIWTGFMIFKTDFPSSTGVLGWDLTQPIKYYFIILLLANFWLGIFNLIPAFPMDGGRILRSLLSLKMDRAKATRIASLAGQVIAFAMFAFGLYQNQPTLALIGVFIFFAARQENQVLQRITRANRMVAGDIADPVIHILHAGMSITTARELIASMDGEHFIVWSRPGVPAGYISRKQIEDEDHTGTIDPFIVPAPTVVSESTPLSQLMGYMVENKIPIVLLSNGSLYTGIIYWEKLEEAVKG